MGNFQVNQMNSGKYQSPYMGADVETVTMSNGAIVNKRMYDFYHRETKEKITKITDRLTVLEGFSIENTVLIEGESGIIVWDTGQNMGIGKRKYEALRKMTNQPIKAIIYSHNHYTKGTQAFLTKDIQDMMVIAHPDLHKNMTTAALELGPTVSRTTAQHFGLYLPHTGPDAAPVSYEGRPDDDKSAGYIQPNYGVQDEEILTIDGVRIQFFYTPSDTYDSLSVWLPDFEAVITNSIWDVLPNVYTLRGQPYRNPVDWIEGIDKLRKLHPKYLIPEHGSPTTTRSESEDVATAYRDILSFIYCQTIRGINRGLKPDEIANSVVLPPHLATHPRLPEVYGEFHHHLKGVYSGLVGWFTFDAADMNPLPPYDRAQKIIEGFGGIERVISTSKKAVNNREYAWAAELITHVLYLEPENQMARQIKADALRQMGYVTPALSSRGFYLSQALELEGKVDIKNVPPGFSKMFDRDAASMQPIEYSVKLLEYKINPEKSYQTKRDVSLYFTDIDKYFGLSVRQGVAEYLEYKPKGADDTLEMDCATWLDFVFGKVSIEELIQFGRIKVTGDTQATIEFFHVFDCI